MNFFAHLVGGIGLFFGSLFGLQANVTSTTTAAAPATTAAASTTVSTPASAPAKPTSFFGKVAALVASTPVPPVPTTVAGAAPATSPTSAAQVTPQAASVGTASIDQTRVLRSTAVKEDSEFYSNTEITGSASSATSVTVAIVPVAQGDTSWAAVSAGAQSRIQTASVSNGKWLVDFKGIDGDSYTVVVYDSAMHVLLSTNSFQIQTSDVLAVPGFNIPMTLGIGQVASVDGVFTAHVKSIGGSASSPTASVSFDLNNAFAGKSFTAKIGDQLPSAGVGFDYDVLTYTQSINVLIKNISFSGKTVTFVMRPLQSTARPY